MNIESGLKQLAVEAFKELYNTEISEESIQVQLTRKDQHGDFTIVVFPLLRYSKKTPEETGKDLGNYLCEKMNEVSAFNVVKGFLNIVLAHGYWIDVLNGIKENEEFGFVPIAEDSPLMMIEYSSPNTNKPLHLGHIRNNLLGYSLSRIASANGHRVVKTNIVNDRGIHICKSMLAWKKWGNGETPESSGKKGDHLVGDYYVKFDQEYKAEQAALTKAGVSKDEAEKQSKLMAEAREMLLKWEKGDDDVVGLWQTMNQWVYEGFDVTYKNLGVDFDKIYYESDTYSVGRDMVLKGLKDGVFFRKDDNSVWVDLEDRGLDQKLLLRSDGTSVYMTQDIGTAKLRFDDYTIDKMVYVVGNEQDYHFKVLSIVLDKLGFDWGKDLVHFSYGMVELPEGKMKSREGTVVDADDLMEEMINTSREMSRELGKLDGYSDEAAEEVIRMIALGALKYFILKVDPRKNMTFNPKESIDFNGNTGPFIQYTHARIRSIFRKAEEKGITWKGSAPADVELSEKENNLVRTVANFPNVVMEAGKAFSPALISNYIYDLAKEFNQFYHDSPILFETDESIREMRLTLCKTVADVLKKGMWLLGAGVPDRM
ncbi:arginine--tRNA ligase [Alkalitalea saponilacus]|uniref:Arginine--tRNA ligase n=1 Tax=Alkalitalea saponilacus TaxID=889453 RepID=A0A1T5H832_9BACT|nr:arginine--tRNA ligase [Alkalitalea saponilacus]ASB50846.1 arginine--tRNA ligase [Alkalitalea saponilacus]SKC16865.1 arginyl-tRNA synthetase [Alkalitalea saponilacus]